MKRVLLLAVVLGLALLVLFGCIPEPPSDWQLYGTWTNDDYNGLSPEGPPAKSSCTKT